MKDKDKLQLVLRAFRLGHVDIDYTLDSILTTYSSSKRFNWHNFSWGVSIGILIGLFAALF